MAQNSPAVTKRTGSQADELERMSQRGDDLRTAIGSDVLDLRSRVRSALDLRQQVARHPFVAAAVVLGGVLVATRIVRKLVRGFQASRGPARRAGSRKESTHLRGGTGRGPGAREAHLKGACE